MRAGAQRVTEAAKLSPLYGLALLVIRPYELWKWKRSRGQGPTPHLWKRRVLLDYARRSGARTLVETGTYMGEMVAAVNAHFQAVYSIELSPQLYAKANDRFRGKPHVHLRQGDSGTILPQILSELEGPTLFWLDAHYSSGVTARGDVETPVMSEIRQILQRPDLSPVILIDDAQYFTGSDGYPSVEEIRREVAAAGSPWVLNVQENIIRIHGRHFYESGV